jgi:16S rRNA (guanine966-N2)-methyltransferase
MNLKVIAGRFGSRKLKSVTTNATRPTAAKVRGAIFNTLGQYFSADMAVLDLFAGSGALAIEAMSRGCGSGVCVERARAACQIIKENVTMLELTDTLQVYCGDYDQYLKTTSADFDLIFIDPPYKMRVIEDTIRTLMHRHIVRAGGRIIIEVSTAIYDEEALRFLAQYDVIFNRAYDTTQIIIIQHNEGERDE